MQASTANHRQLSSPPPLLTTTTRRPITRRTRHHHLAISAQNPEEVEIRVCVNRSCGRQGSRSVLDVLSALAPPPVAVSSCGCLGRCGAGPNLAVIPPGSVLGHCGTPARAARVLAELCGPHFDADRALEAFALRKKGEDGLDKGNFEEAEALLSRAIDLRPSGGLQFMYRFRSAARLGKGDNEGALRDAEIASQVDPKFAQAYVCQGDALSAMEEWTAAEKAYSNALLTDPSLRRSKSFKAKVARLQEKLVPLDASS